MIDVKTLQGLFGGAFLGIIAVKAPSALGFAYRPTHAVEFGAALLGVALAAIVYFREHRREKKAKEPIRLGR